MRSRLLAAGGVLLAVLGGGVACGAASSSPAPAATQSVPADLNNISIANDPDGVPGDAVYSIAVTNYSRTALDYGYDLVIRDQSGALVDHETTFGMDNVLPGETRAYNLPLQLSAPDASVLTISVTNFHSAPHPAG